MLEVGRVLLPEGLFKEIPLKVPPLILRDIRVAWFMVVIS
jgi:hypothetical protein